MTSESVLVRSRLENGSELTSTPRSGEEMSDAARGAMDEDPPPGKAVVVVKVLLLLLLTPGLADDWGR